jgi:hypothetical protein
MTEKNNGKNHELTDSDIKDILSREDFVYYTGLREDDSEKLNKERIRKINSALLDAKDALGIEKAHNIFASENLPDLIERHYFTHFLKNNETKLMSRKELENDTELFLGELFQHCDYIIRTGLTENQVPYGYSYLRDELSNLYCLDSHWGREDEGLSALAAHGQDGDKGFQSTKRVNTIRGLSDEDIKKIEADRPMLLELEINIIKELLYSIKNHTDDVTRVRCLEFMAEKLDKCDLDFYARVDSLYDPLMGSGGTLHLFNIMQHYEIESQLSIFSKMRDVLGDLVMVVEGDREFSFYSYFEAVRESRQEPIKKAYEIYLSCKSDMEEFLKEYCSGVESYINNEFKERVISEVSVKPKLSGGIQKQGDGFLKYMKEQSELIGYVPVYDVTIRDSKDIDKILYSTTGTSHKEKVPMICFFKDSGSWLVGELLGEKKSFSVKGNKGMERLHYLISDPETPHSCIDIFNLGKIDTRSENMYNPADDENTSDDEDNAATIGGKIFGGEKRFSITYDTVDRGTKLIRFQSAAKIREEIEQLKIKRAQLQDKLSAIDPYGSPDERLILVGDIENTDQAIEEREIRLKVDKKESDKVRSTIQKTIRDAVDEITNAITDMSIYLNKVTIQSGDPFYYKPQFLLPVHWILTVEAYEKLKKK